MPRILAIDYGQARIGLAMSDFLGMLAQPYKTIFVENKQKTLAEISRVVQEEKVEEVILGLPLGLEGNETQKTAEVRKFALQLEKILQIPLTLWDERFSTYTAMEELRRMGKSPSKCRDLIDQLAACVILRSYLEHKE